ncbi:hypothetical protein B5E88_07790 [Enterococcus cecorum]|uniref:Type I restriction modification DNA specificity domain-containing protein n=2 Tax=Enterococcus cecorum TaxID=44008 RepID=A0A1Y4QYF0_9ENTE|nr:hypothetical protein B5E88_07790 [Enterococcus cecorum]
MVLTMYKYRLEDVEWRRFKVGGKDGIFKVKNSKPYHKANLNVASNGIPYVTRTSMNNGLEDLIVDANYEKNPKNTISLGAENADFFFQGVEYVSGNKMYCISNDKITREVGLFLVQIFRQSIKECGFGYGKGLTGTRFKNRYIMLPIDENNKPNWHFMEEYIKERENKQREVIKEYYKERLNELSTNYNTLTKIDWQEYFIEDVAEIKSGKDIYERERSKGNTPYITATANNNGIGYFVGNMNKTLQSKCISVNRNGSVGHAFYHSYEALYGNDTRKLMPFYKNDQTSLFFTCVISNQREKYGYGYKMGTGRLKRQKVMLPVINGKIDYHYMENYIKNIEKKKIEQILEYLDR